MSVKSIRVRITESSDNLVSRVKMKLKRWLGQLSPEERAIVVSSLQKPTATELLDWCGDARDKLDGRDDDEQLKQQQFRQKLKKDAQNNSPGK